MNMICRVNTTFVSFKRQNLSQGLSIAVASRVHSAQSLLSTYCFLRLPKRELYPLECCGIASGGRAERKIMQYLVWSGIEKMAPEHSEEAAPGRGDIVKNNDSVQERIAYLTQRSSDTERDEHRTAELPVDHAISHPTLLIAARRRKSESASVTFCNFAPAKLKMMKKGGRRTERFCRPRSDG